MIRKIQFSGIVGMLLFLSPMVLAQTGRNQPDQKKKRDEQIEQLKMQAKQATIQAILRTLII